MADPATLIQYDKLDAALVDNIRRYQPASLCRATGGEARLEAERIAAETGREVFRIQDARLQVLRERGVIEYKRGRGIGKTSGWVVQPAATANATDTFSGAAA